MAATRMGRHRRRLTALGLATILLGTLSISVMAHDEQTSGRFRLTVGWGEEPAFAGSRNSVVVALSAVDGHASSGLYVFGVLVEPPSASGSAAPVDASASAPEAIARTLFLSGLVLLLGAAAADIGRFGFGREVTLAGVGWVVSVAGLALLASAQWRVADVGLAALSGTAIGRALLWRTVAIGAAGIAIGLAVFGIRTERRHFVHLGLHGIALAALTAVAVHSAAGHAAAGRWPVFAAVAFQTVHIAAVGIWLGGLAALLAGVRGSPSDLKAQAVGRFSKMAAAGFVVVMTTGVVRSVHELSGWGDLTSTAYGRVVLAKVALLIGIGALGALHRSHTVPMTAWSLRPLRLVGSLELALAVVALAAAGFLGALFPPAAGQRIAGIDVSGADFGTSVRARGPRVALERIPIAPAHSAGKGATMRSARVPDARRSDP